MCTERQVSLVTHGKKGEDGVREAWEKRAEVEEVGVTAWTEEDQVQEEAEK
ncbi:hypothetical protein FACS189472_19000 [Alphaproteobacteria bacterium]|nr:hypothetical protein FACS189472_19000 [Alphaproteobacteria bacterium]